MVLRVLIKHCTANMRASQCYCELKNEASRFYGRANLQNRLGKRKTFGENRNETANWGSGSWTSGQGASEGSRPNLSCIGKVPVHV